MAKAVSIAAIVKRHTAPGAHPDEGRAQLHLLGPGRMEDILALAGVSNADRNANVLDMVKARLPWLLLNTLTAAIAASVIRAFEGEILKLVTLAMLMPIVASLGGNAGTQTLAVAACHWLQLQRQVESRSPWSRWHSSGWVNAEACGCCAGSGARMAMPCARPGCCFCATTRCCRSVWPICFRRRRISRPQPSRHARWRGSCSRTGARSRWTRSRPHACASI